MAMHARGPSGCLDSWDSDLSGQQHADAAAVLAYVKRDGRFSVWEMTQALTNTLRRLERAGSIVEVPREYPVIQYRAATSAEGGTP